MKHIFGILLLCIFFASCTQGESEAEKKTETYRQTPVQNVNGNIPDTTNSINLQTHGKSGSTNATDTTHH